MLLRIQRKRIAGWRMPPNTVSVTRPGRFGNPFRVTEWLTLPQSLKLFDDACHGIWSPDNIAHLSDDRAKSVYKYFCEWRKRLGQHPTEAIQAELHLCHNHQAGKSSNIICVDCQPCHADILLEIANR